jgi:hypothetical protein
VIVKVSDTQGARISHTKRNTHTKDTHALTHTHTHTHTHTEGLSLSLFSVQDPVPVRVREKISNSARYEVISLHLGAEQGRKREGRRKMRMEREEKRAVGGDSTE